MATRIWRFSAVVFVAASLAACAPSSKSSLPAKAFDRDSTEARTRYEFANRCVVLQSASNNRYVSQTDGQFSANATLLNSAETFYLKPTSLGSYLLYTSAGQLLNTAATPGTNALSAASDSNIFTLRVLGDATNYVQPPITDKEPTPEEIAAYRGFVDPNTKGTVYTLTSTTGERLQANAAEPLSMAAASEATAQQFRLLTLETCTAFPEAQNNASGETFKGKTADGRVLGMADVHVHLSATNFLGNAQYGNPFHRFGVTHALGDCADQHGPQGSRDAVGALLGQDFDGHTTDGWPTFTSWPARGMLTHEAIYWKWLERAWMAGLRVMVNDVVENETLCELQRNIAGTPDLDCNEMNSAARQVGTLYALQDYIDAQYGDRGKGWFRIVLSPSEARSVIEQGKLALVIGIEISNVLDCKVIYNPLRTLEPFEEPLEFNPLTPTENRYTCTQLGG